LTIVCIDECLLVMILGRYMSISEVRRVVLVLAEPCCLAGAAVLPLGADSAALSRSNGSRASSPSNLRDPFLSTLSSPRPVVTPLLHPTPMFLSLFSLHTRGRRASPFFSSSRQPASTCSATLLGLNLCSGRPRLGCRIPLLLFPLQSTKVKARWNPSPLSIYAMLMFWSWILCSRCCVMCLE
jgi:hypothetical protein